MKKQKKDTIKTRSEFLKEIFFNGIVILDPKPEIKVNEIEEEVDKSDYEVY